MRKYDLNESAMLLNDVKLVETKYYKTIIENLDGAFLLTECRDNQIDIKYINMNTQEYFGTEQINNDLIWKIVYNEDLENLKQVIINASQRREPIDFNYRIYDVDGSVRWQHLKGIVLPESVDQTNPMLHISTDITIQKQIEAELHEKERIVDFAMKNTDVNLWYFDFEKEECHLTESCQMAHEMPGVDLLQNFPECLVQMEYVREDCVELLKNSYSQLRETGESLEFDVWFKKQDGTGYWCERDMLSPLIGSDGRVTRGIGIGKDVTAEKEIEAKFHVFETYKSLVHKSALISAHFNLTTGACSELKVKNLSYTEILHIETVKEFFQKLSTYIPQQEEREKFQKYSKESLLDSYAEGKNEIEFEAQIDIENEKQIWIRGIINMVKNPATGHVEAMFYAYSIDYEMKMKLMIDQLLTADYEFLALINAKTGDLMILGENRDYQELEVLEKNYDEKMPEIFGKLIHSEYLEASLLALSRTQIIEELKDKKYYTCSFPTRKFNMFKEGRKQWKCSYLDDSQKEILITRTDITDIYTAERDELTGLLNRHAYYRHVRAILNTNPSVEFVMVRTDIDRFKTYNDVKGTKAGDRILAEFGKKVKNSNLPKLCIVGRIQADHFCMLIPKRELDLNNRKKRFYEWLGSIEPDYRLISSIGIYEITNADVDVSLMCDRALLALQSIKETYDNKVSWYNDGLRQKLMIEQILIDEMEFALKEEQFVLFFQPQINYEDASLVGAEALVRWIHPERGIIAPGEFIPLFEKNGFILKLDTYVWEKTCKQIREWMDVSFANIVPISVNISRYDICDSTICDKLIALVRKYEIPSSLLKLEITESAYMENPEQLLLVARKLQSYGFTVEMDDFGTGYSSLNILKDVPVDVLKLDMRFLSKGWDDSRGGLILASIIRMARWLNLPIIAEGVENIEQAEYLKSLSCVYMQGYLFAKPMPVKEYERHVATLQGNHIKLCGKIEEQDLKDTIWNSESIDSILFHKYVGGAAIIEYDGCNVEIVRANDKFYKELLTTRDQYQISQKNTLLRFDKENGKRYIQMLEEAIQTGEDAECEIESLPHGNLTTSFITYNRVRQISASYGHYIFYLEVRNIKRHNSF